jgi:ABC-type transport system involved in cytochrome c biogenesis permease component
MVAMLLRQIGILVWKDAVTDLRRKEHWLAMFFFAVLTLLLFHFALDAGQDPRYRITPRVVERLGGEGVARAAELLAPVLGRSFPSSAAVLDALAGVPAADLSPEHRVALLALAREDAVQEAAPGLIWVAFVLAGVLGLAKSFAQEREQGSLEGLLLTPVPRGVLYLGKMLGNALFLAVLLALLVPLAGLLLGVDLRGAAGPLALALLGGVLGFSALGTRHHRAGGRTGGAAAAAAVPAARAAAAGRGAPDAGDFGGRATVGPMAVAAPAGRLRRRVPRRVVPGVRQRDGGVVVERANCAAESRSFTPCAIRGLGMSGCKLW